MQYYSVYPLHPPPVTPLAAPRGLVCSLTQAQMAGDFNGAKQDLKV